MAYEKRPGNRGKGGSSFSKPGSRTGQPRTEGGYKGGGKPQGGYGKPAQGGYGKPAPGGYGRPQEGGYGKPAPGGYGKPAQGGFGKPAPGGYGKPAQGGYGKPAQGGHGRPQEGGYGRPQEGGYGKPQQGGYRKPSPGGYAKPQGAWQGRPHQQGNQRPDEFFSKPPFNPAGPGPRRAAPSGRPVPPATRVDRPQSYQEQRPVEPDFDRGDVALDQDVSREHILAGRNPIREAIKAGKTIDKLLVQSGELSGSARQIVAWAREAHIIVQHVDKARLDQIYPNHQGMVAYTAAAEYSTVDDILAFALARGEQPFVVVLDSVTDPHNLGAIIRSAECAGAHGVIVTERRSALLTPAAVKASAGACEHQRIAKVVNLSRTLAELKEHGLWVIGADMAGEPVYQADLSGPIALVIGSEGEGISQLVAKQCDKLVALPVKGKIDSLNASVAAGVLMYEVLRARN